LVVVVCKATLEVKGFYIVLPRQPEKEEIFILQVFEKRKGLGKMIVQRERRLKPRIELYVDETLGSAVPFWDALEIPYNSVIHK